MRPDEGAYGIHVLVHAHQQREMTAGEIGDDGRIRHQAYQRVLVRLIEGVVVFGQDEQHAAGPPREMTAVTMSACDAASISKSAICR